MKHQIPAHLSRGLPVSKQNRARMVRWAIKRSILATNPGKRFPLDAEGVSADREPVAYMEAAA